MELRRVVSVSLLILVAALVFAGAAKFFNKNIIGQSSDQVNVAIPEGLHPEFAAYVSGYTGGFIHSTEGIKVRFTEAIADSGAFGEEIIPNPFNLNVACKAYWDDDRTIICKPEKTWDRNVVIKGDFDLANYFNIQNNDLKKFPIQAQILPQEAQIEFKRWIANPNSPNAYSLEIGVSLLDGDEGAGLEAAFSASLNDKNLKATWTHTNASAHTVVISNIIRSNGKQTLTANVDLSQLGGSDILSANFEVPAENSFECWKVSANREKGLVLSFTENVVAADKLNGLFYSDDFTISGIEVIGTEVYLYGSFDDYIYGDIKVRADAAVQSTNGHSLGKISYLTTNLGANLPAIREEFSANSQFMYPISGSSKFCFNARGLKSAQLVVNEVEMSRIENSFTESYSSLIELKGEEITRKVISLGTFSETKADGFNTYHIDLNTLFTAKPGKGYQITLSFEETDMIEPCNTGLASINPAKDPAYVSTANYYDYYDEYGNENAVVQCLRQKGGNNNEIENLSMKSFFVKTNIGLIVKKLSNFKTAVYAVDIITGGPKAGVNVSLMNNGRKVLGSGTTNADGMALFTHTQTAALAKATDGSSISIISLTSTNSVLSLSDFNTTGSNGDSKSAYLFSERDMYRPGDSIHFGIILPPLSELNPEELRLPIVLEVTDSKGSKVLSKVIAKNQSQMHRYSLATKTSWPTGTYRSVVSIGSKSTFYNIKLETTKPNRLNISLDPKADFLINNQANAFSLESTYLFGADVTNGKALVTATATDFTYRYDKYEDYFFYGQAEGNSENVVLYEGPLDDKGKAKFSWTPNLKGTNPQILKVSTTIFEESGEPSIDLSTRVVFPTANAIGIKLLKKSDYGQQSYTKTEPIIFDYVHFSNGKVAEPSYSTVMKLYKQNPRSWYNGETGTYSEQNENLETLVFSSSYQWKSKGTFTFDIPTQFQDGEYRIEFSNLEADLYTSFLININEYDYYSSAANANHIGLRTDKESYTIDNDINLSFNSPKAGMALLTYERGNLLIGQKWMNVVAGNNKVKINPTAEMAPGIYLSVYLMQEYASTAATTDMLVFGLKYIEIGNKGARLIPEITVPETVLPEANTQITIKEKEGKPMTYMLAIVDEGLLNMTNFTAPNSYNYFYGKHFLGINSYENLSQFVNAKMAQFANQTAGGGDRLMYAPKAEDGMNDLEAAGFRFKPLVKVLGPFTLGAKDSEKHSFNAEGYVGAVRVMVVAANDRNFGSAEKLVIVSSDLMIQGAAPRLVGPTDAVKIPLSLFGKKGIKNAKIQFKVKGEGKLVGANTQNINFTNERAMAYLDVATTGKTGLIQLEAVATSGKWQHTWKVTLPVRSATSRQTSVNTLTLAPGETKTIQFSGIQPQGKPLLGLEINSLPKLQIEKNINYLLNYPYGCLEQTVSAAFPQIYLSKLTKLDNLAKNKAAYHVNEAISRLNSFRSNVTDGFSYWPGTSQVDPWANLYAFHFLNIAQSEGFVVPESYTTLMKNYLQGLQKSINTGSAEGQTFLAYAAYVASLSSYNDSDSDYELSNTFAIPTANGLIQRSELSEEARMLCALTLNNYKVASSVINSPNSKVVNGATFANPLRSIAIKLLVSCKLNKNSNQSFEIASVLVNEMNNNGWYNTQTVSWSMIALAAYSEKYGAGNATAAVSIANKPTENITLNGLSWKQSLAPRNVTKGVTVKNTGKGTLYLNAITNTLPKPGEEKNISSQMDISIVYKDLQGNPINPVSLPSGTSFKATITVKQLAKVNSDHAAVNFRLPGGWELDNSRLANDAENPFPNTEYTDFRDDRMSIFLGLRAGEVRVFEIGIKATYAGKYFMPGIQAEDMYQTTIRTAKAGGYVVVTK